MEATHPLTNDTRPIELEAGARLGEYELVLRIGSGGMGTVWAARRRGTGAIVALKTILPAESESGALRKMFLDEGRLAMLLSHPNICRLLDFGSAGGRLFMVLEWVEGDSLRNALLARAERPSVDVALRIARALCDALEAAHELRDEDGVPLDLVHRDVSPQNVLLGLDGSVKLIDFGIAKTRQRLAETTNSGVLRGKLRYMAPEQVDGTDAVDRRADLWAAGAVLFALLTGEELFGPANEADILRTLVMREGLPSLPSDVPRAVQSLVFRALAFEREQRFATAGAMCEAIDALLPRATARDREAIAVFARARCGQAVSARAARIDDVLARLDAATSPGPAPRSGASEKRRLLASIGATAIVTAGAAFGAVQLLAPDRPSAPPAQSGPSPRSPGATNDVPADPGVQASPPAPTSTATASGFISGRSPDGAPPPGRKRTNGGRAAKAKGKLGNEFDTHE